MNKKIILAVALVLVALSFVEVRNVSANNGTKGNKQAKENILKKMIKKNKVQENANSMAQKRHLNFIAAQLEESDLTTKQKKAVMDKLAGLMKSQPTSEEFVKMSKTEQKEVIATWKKEMGAWVKKNDLTLEELRESTGKGNKYLMGIEF